MLINGNIIFAKKNTFMKHLLFLLLSCTLLISSCKKNDLEPDELIVGFWKSELIIANGADITDFVDIDYDFQKSGRFGATYYDYGNGSTTFGTGKYFFTGKEKIALDFDNSSNREDYDITDINDKTMEMEGTVKDSQGNSYSFRGRFRKQ